VSDEAWIARGHRALALLRRALLDSSLEGDTQRVLSLSCNSWGTALEMQSAWIAFFSDDIEELEIVASFGVPEKLLTGWKQVTASAPATSRSFAAGHPLLLEDPGEWSALSSGPVLLAALGTQSSPLGVIAGDWKGTPAPPEESLIALAVELSAQIELSLATSRRIGEAKASVQSLEARVRELEGLMDAGQRDRRIAEESMELMRSATARLHAIIDQMPQGVAVARAPDGAIVMANPMAARILRPNSTGHLSSQVLKGDGSPYPPGEWPLTRALRGETPPPEVVLVIGPEGRHSTILMRAAPVYDLEGRVGEALLILQDIA
jgi:PAS domain-containing protein